GRDLWSITYGELAVDFRQLLRSYYIVFKVATRNAVKVTYLYVYDFESNMVYIDHETGTTYVTRNLLVRRLLSVYNNGQILSSKVDFFNPPGVMVLDNTKDNLRRVYSEGISPLLFMNDMSMDKLEREGVDTTYIKTGMELMSDSPGDESFNQPELGDLIDMVNFMNNARGKRTLK